eukprot:scaffold102479_cov51-Attheya_sp.AAC.3
MARNGGFWKPGGAGSSALAEDGTGESAAAPFNFSRSPLHQQRMLLPIHKHRRQILYAMEKYNVLVIVGETGSGKSTQLPQYLHENGWTDNGFQVVCTQPRRVAAQTLAQRVAAEVACDLGKDVGYTVRFDDCSSPVTKIKYVTDGMLLREATLSDPLLSKYSVIMIDEAHERNLNSDALLGIIKKIRRKRPNLRVVVCSATIDARAFLDFFTSHNKKHPKSTEENKTPPTRQKKRRWGRVGEDTKEPQEEKIDLDEEDREDGTIISIDGRQHPVDIMHLSEPASDYIRSSVEIALKIHAEEDGGDILSFLPTGEDIDRAISISEELLHSSSQSGTKKRAIFLPLYGSLPYQMQARVFQPKPTSERNSRRIIYATNIAETSVTVPDITHVIDCGYSKIPFHDPKTGFDRLIVCPISQASARQRSGRSGRVQPGKAYRLYTEQAMLKTMEKATPPEVLRSNLTSFILTLKALGVHNILAFDLMDVPDVDAITHGLECLYALGAIDDNTNLTSLGMDMSAFPTEPRVSRMLLESLKEGCAREVLCVASSMQMRSIILRPRTQRQKIDYDMVLGDIADQSGDHVTYVDIMERQDESPMNEEECKESFLSYLALKRATEVRLQLARFLRRYGQVTGLNKVDVDDEERSKRIRKCVTSGFFFNVAKLGNDGRYYTLRGKHLVTVSSSSVLHSHGDISEYIIFAETHDGTRGGIEVRSCSTIDGRWLRELAPHYWA